MQQIVASHALKCTRRPVYQKTLTPGGAMVNIDVEVKYGSITPGTSPGACEV